MGSTEFHVRMEGPVSIVEVRGVVDRTVAADLMEFAAAAAQACGSVEIELGLVDSITPDAAELLLFREAPWHAFPERITLRAGGQPGRKAVLRAYARRRARTQSA
jgi:hypothetical protein